MTAVVGAGRRRERRGEERREEAAASARRRARRRRGEVVDPSGRLPAARVLRRSRRARARCLLVCSAFVRNLVCALCARDNGPPLSRALLVHTIIYIYKISLILYSRIVDYICLYRLLHQMVTHVRLSLRLSLRCLFASPRTPPIPLGRAAREAERERERGRVSEGGREGEGGR